MPWLTLNTQVTAEDVQHYEALLDQLAQDDREARLRAAYTPHMDLEPLSPANYYRHPDYMAEGWEPAELHCHAPRLDHHD